MSGPHPVVYVSLLAVLLFGAALLLPENGISGYVLEPSCGELGCVELCDTSCSEPGMACCPTAWGTGVCDYPESCGKIQEYADRMSLTQYQDTVRERPAPISSDWARFVIPLVVVLGLTAWIVRSGRSRKRLLR